MEPYVLRPGPQKGHPIRWFGILPDGSRVPRTRYMQGRDWGWDAHCACGWDSRTGGAIQERVREAVQDHLRDVANPPLSPQEVREILASWGA